MEPAWARRAEIREDTQHEFAKIGTPNMKVSDIEAGSDLGAGLTSRVVAVDSWVA
ncbi:MAG: hypothetical protein WA608_08985 [Candidatus Acidiferrales bacterium]